MITPDMMMQLNPVQPQTWKQRAGDLFQDKNFLALLAGTGQGLDPEGVGGAIGGPTQQMIKNVAMQEAAQGLSKERQEHMKQLTQLLTGLGGISAPGQPGVTSLKMGKDGNIMMDLNPIKVDGGTPSIAPSQTQPQTPAQPAQPSQASVMGGAAQSPFFRALLG